MTVNNCDQLCNFICAHAISIFLILCLSILHFIFAAYALLLGLGSLQTIAEEICFTRPIASYSPCWGPAWTRQPHEGSQFYLFFLLVLCLWEVPKDCPGCSFCQRKNVKGAPDQPRRKTPTDSFVTSCVHLRLGRLSTRVNHGEPPIYVTRQADVERDFDHFKEAGMAFTSEFVVRLVGLECGLQVTFL